MAGRMATAERAVFLATASMWVTVCCCSGGRVATAKYVMIKTVKKSHAEAQRTQSKVISNVV